MACMDVRPRPNSATGGTGPLLRYIVYGRLTATGAASALRTPDALLGSEFWLAAADLCVLAQGPE